MASVGAVNCSFVHGTPTEGKQEVRTWRMPGVNGYGAHLLGLGDADFELAAVFFSNCAGVETWFAAMHALQGTVVSIVTDRGLTYTYCLIEHIDQPKVTAALNGAITQRGELRLKCKRV